MKKYKLNDITIIENETFANKNKEWCDTYMPIALQFDKTVSTAVANFYMYCSYKTILIQNEYIRIDVKYENYDIGRYDYPPEYLAIDTSFSIPFDSKTRVTLRYKIRANNRNQSVSPAVKRKLAGHECRWTAGEFEYNINNVQSAIQDIQTIIDAKHAIMEKCSKELVDYKARVTQAKDCLDIIKISAYNDIVEKALQQTGNTNTLQKTYRLVSDYTKLYTGQYYYDSNKKNESRFTIIFSPDNSYLNYYVQIDAIKQSNGDVVIEYSPYISDRKTIELKNESNALNTSIASMTYTLYHAVDTQTGTSAEVCVKHLVELLKAEKHVKEMYTKYKSEVE